MDGMLLVAPVNSWSEAAPGRLFFFGNLIIWCHGIRWGLRRIPSTQIVGQHVRRSVRFQVRRFAPSSGFVSHGPTPLMCREPTPPYSRGSYEPTTLPPFGCRTWPLIYEASSLARNT